MKIHRLLFSLMLIMWVPFVQASSETEKLKLEIEKLKLENENLRLQKQAPTEAAPATPLDECLKSKNIESCWEYYNNPESRKARNYVADLQKIKAVLNPFCIKPTDEPCSLLAKIMYENDSDLKAIPMMEAYCEQSKGEMSQRCHDLVLFYIGKGTTAIDKPDLVKAERFARRCEAPDSVFNCGSIGLDFLDSPHIPAASARLIGHSLLRKYLTSKNAPEDGKRLAEFLLNCKLEIIFEKPKISSTGFIGIFARYKNHGKFPLKFAGETSAYLVDDHSKVFVSQFFGKTLSGRKMGVGELIRERQMFQVDDDKAAEFVSKFRMTGFKLTDVRFEDAIWENNLDRVCAVDVKFE